MTGLSDAREAAILNAEFTSTTYLRLLSGTAGQSMNDNGTFPAGCTEVTGGAYAPLAIPTSYWAAAIAGSPTIKTLPSPAHSPLTFTPSGSSWNVCGWALTTNTSAITSANLIFSAIFVDVSSVPMVHHVGDGEPLTFTDTYPLIVRLGDTPATGVNPT